LDRESITNLIKLAEIAIKDDFSDIDRKYTPQYYATRAKDKGGVLSTLQEMNYQQGNETQRKIIIPILRIFISLCSTPTFHWHLSKYNALDLLNRIREKDDEFISDVAKDVCEKVIDHRDEGQINNSLNVVGGSAALSSQGGNGSTGNNDASITADYNIVNEINSIVSESNLQRVKTSIVNLEKMLIQRKLKLDQVGNDELKKLVQLLEKTIKSHREYAKAASAAEGLKADEELNATLRRIIIKSLLVVLNFVYSKKYLRDVISGLA
jgi:hypothetical protein